MKRQSVDDILSSGILAGISIGDDLDTAQKALNTPIKAKTSDPSMYANLYNGALGLSFSEDETIPGPSHNKWLANC